MATIVVREWDTAGIDPSGSRNSSAHASFVKVLASGTTSSGVIEFGNVSIGDGDVLSVTKCFTVSFIDFADANETVDSCTVYLDNTDISGSSTVILHEQRPSWTQGFEIQQSEDQQVLPGSGLTTDIVRTDGNLTFFQDSDEHCSQYFYLTANVKRDTNAGVYGGSTGGLSLMFNYSVNTENTNRD